MWFNFEFYGACITQKLKDNKFPRVSKHFRKNMMRRFNVNRLEITKMGLVLLLSFKTGV